MDATANMLWHTECCGESVDCAGGMRKDGKLGDLERLADSIDVIYSRLVFALLIIIVNQKGRYTRPAEGCCCPVSVRLAITNTRPIRSDKP